MDGPYRKGTPMVPLEAYRPSGSVDGSIVGQLVPTITRTAMDASTPAASAMAEAKIGD